MARKSSSRNKRSKASSSRGRGRRSKRSPQMTETQNRSTGRGEPGMKDEAE